MMIRGTTQIALKPMPLCGFRQTLCTNAAAHWERLLSGEHLSFPDSEGIDPRLHDTCIPPPQALWLVYSAGSVFVNVFP